MEEASKLTWSDLKTPLPDLIRQSCAKFVDSSPYVKINSEKLSDYVSNFDLSKLEAIPEKMYPLNFKDQEAEINFITTLNLLNFGSGYRIPLHKSSGKGAFETIQFGTMGMFLTNELDADFFTSLGIYDISQIFDIKIQEEYEMMPGIRSERKTELYSLAEMIKVALHQAGATLKNLQCKDFAQFILHPPAGVQPVVPETDGKPRAVNLLHRLVRFFSCLQDAYVLPHDTTVYIIKKAQLIVADLYLKFHKQDPRFDFVDISTLTVFSDNVLPAVLRGLGIIEVNDELAKQIDENQKITNPAQECALRAAAVVACDLIVEKFNANQPAVASKESTEEEKKESSTSSSSASSSSEEKKQQLRLTHFSLDYHLWLQGKVPEFRKLARHATESIYY